MAAPIKAWKRYILHFAHEHLEFRLPETISICEMFGFPYEIDKEYAYESPYTLVNLPSDDCARKLASRSFMIRSIHEWWGDGKSVAELKETLHNYPSALKEPYMTEKCSFKFTLETFNRSLSKKVRGERINNYVDPEVLPFKGKIDLKNSAQTFGVMEYYGPSSSLPPDEPFKIYLGRWICDGQRDRVKDYDLKQRQFISNTSMDPLLSLIMANMGQARPGAIVFDPFVGSGSLLIASSHSGAYTIGSDIDFKLLHGVGKSSRHDKKWRKRGDGVRSNMEQYQLTSNYLDILVADASLHKMWRNQTIFDAIITDPPYGIREPTEKIGGAKTEAELHLDPKKNAIPNKISYGLMEILKDLLNFAAKFLHIGGRLVYWLPVFRPEYVEENVPTHPCLKLCANCEQILTARIGRRLITMEKIQHYQDGMEANVSENHYSDASFRDKYFRPSDYQSKTESSDTGSNFDKSDLANTRANSSGNDVSNTLTRSPNSTDSDANNLKADSSNTEAASNVTTDLTNSRNSPT